MTLLQASDLFALDAYEHRSLFDGCQFIWEVLPKIALYLEQYAFQGSEESYPGVTFINRQQIFIGQGTQIEPGAYIHGPCIIGQNCTIRHAAYLRGNVIAGDNCVIGHCTELKNVILLDKVHIAHLAYGGDSIFGNGCNLGAGVKCANLKLDGTAVVVRDGAQTYATGLRKFGAILGDGVQLGCNSVTNPGTILGKNSRLYPCTNFGGVASDDSIIRLDAKLMIKTKRK